jgi:hypothetical protein
MARGGARNRSGPQPDPTSGRSDRRGFKLTALPSEGFGEDPPEFPLPTVTRYEQVERMRVANESATASFRERELAVWADAWSTPQACAWSMQSWRWQTVAEYCRIKTAVELDPDASAALVGQLHRFRDQIGLTPAGLRENGWAIAVDEVAEKRDAPKAVTAAPSRRLRAVDG